MLYLLANSNRKLTCVECVKNVECVKVTEEWLAINRNLELEKVNKTVRGTAQTYRNTLMSKLSTGHSVKANSRPGQRHRKRTSDGSNGNHSVSLSIILIKIKVDQILPSSYLSSLLVYIL